MPVIKSAIKKLRQDKKRESQNLLVRNAVKEAIKKFKKKPTPSLLSKVFKVLDTAAKKNIFHANKAARLKSNLAKLLGKKPTAATVKAKTSPKKKAAKSAKTNLKLTP